MITAGEGFTAPWGSYRVHRLDGDLVVLADIARPGAYVIRPAAELETGAPYARVGAAPPPAVHRDPKPANVSQARAASPQRDVSTPGRGDGAEAAAERATAHAMEIRRHPPVSDDEACAWLRAVFRGGRYRCRAESCPTVCPRHPQFGVPQRPAWSPPELEPGELEAINAGARAVLAYAFGAARQGLVATGAPKLAGEERVGLPLTRGSEPDQDDLDAELAAVAAHPMDPPPPANVCDDCGRVRRMLAVHDNGLQFCFDCIEPRPSRVAKQLPLTTAAKKPRHGAGERDVGTFTAPSMRDMWRAISSEVER